EAAPRLGVKIGLPRLPGSQWQPRRASPEDGLHLLRRAAPLSRSNPLAREDTERFAEIELGILAADEALAAVAVLGALHRFVVFVDTLRRRTCRRFLCGL